MRRRTSLPIGAPWFHIVGLMLLAAGTLCIAFLNAHVKAYILDETLIKQSAVHYTTGLPGSLFNDVNARATSRFYSLLVAPFFAVGVGDSAVRAARATNAVLFASASAPAYLLAGFVFPGRAAIRCVLALLAVFLPWVVLSSAMFTEALAYPLFLWSVYALARLYVKPTPGRDLLAVATVALATVARTQLIALAFAYLVIVVLRAAGDLRTPGVPWYVALDRLIVRRLPVAILLTLGTAAVVLWLSRRGTLTTHLDSLLGTYASTTTNQKALPRDVGLSTSVELIGLAAGTGVLPVVAGLTWIVFAASGRLSKTWTETAFARVVLIVGCALFAATLYSQSSYLGPATEERYYFYVAPLLIIAGWRGVLGRLSDANLAAAAVVMVACASILPLPRSLEDPESNFFAPGLATARSTAEFVERTLTSALGRSALSNADLVAGVFAVMLVTVLLLRRFVPSAGPLAGLGLAATVQIIVTAVCVTSVTGAIPGIRGRTDGPPFARLGFVDRASGGSDVTWLDNQPKVVGPPEDDAQRRALLYNDRIVRRASIPQVPTIADNFPLSGLPLESLSIDAATGQLRRVDLAAPLTERFFVQTEDSPLTQMDARRVGVAAPMDRLELVKTSGSPRLRWAAQGLDGAGRVSHAPASLRAWGRYRTAVSLVAETPGRVSIDWLGKRTRAFIRRGGELTVHLPKCGAGAGTISTTGQVRLTKVAQRRC